MPTRSLKKTTKAILRHWDKPNKKGIEWVKQAKTIHAGKVRNPQILRNRNEKLEEISALQKKQMCFSFSGYTKSKDDFP